MNRVMVACATVAFVIASSMSYSDEQVEQDHYCAMISAGAWPDYNKDIDCGDDYER